MKDFNVPELSLAPLMDKVFGTGKVYHFVALKILASDNDDDSETFQEYKILKPISVADPTHPGYRLVRTLLDSSETLGPHGKHMCLVHKSMREDLATLLNRFRGHTKLAGYLIKSILKHIFLALDDFHSSCQVIHTGKAHDFYSIPWMFT